MRDGNLFYSLGSPSTSITDEELRSAIFGFLDSRGDRNDVLILPPDFTRFHSRSGVIVQHISEYYNFTPSSSSPSESGIVSSPSIEIIPALGTHAPMSHDQIEKMFGRSLATADPSPFVVHNWREDVVTIGHAPAEMVSKATHGMVCEPWPAQINKKVWERRLDIHDEKKGPPPLVISVGQVVPHEVLGMANFNKNLFVGVGGVEAINLSHFIGAVHGMEKLMGRGQNPLRDILSYCSESYLQSQYDLWYILTVMGTDDKTGEIEMKGLYIGRDQQCYDLACDLSLKVNFNLLDREPKKMVVYLNEEYKSTWLGNKSIYRTRMALADGGELIVLAPWVETCAEEETLDRLVRSIGYVGTPAIMDAMEKREDLKRNLSVVAHLIHGSSEGRFDIVYCPGKLTKEETERVGFRYAPLEAMLSKYDIDNLEEGWNTRSGEEFYYISNPALGLWAVESRFRDDKQINYEGSFETTTISPNQKAGIQSGGVGGWKLPPE
mmetsp:Transcript_16298/g.37689  ORF Transcript_16298/g.37689 Transcript_16298/m.37689 type:complete len:494 (+) Transcript_16298:493-1974(+)